MRLPERKIAEILEAKTRAFAAAAAIPTERLQWKPLDTGQTVMSMARELAKTPDWARYVLTGAKPEEPEKAAEAQRKEMEGWRTIAECETACDEKLEPLLDFYRGLSDEDLIRTKWLPFNGGRDHTYAELLDYPRWNFAYHCGQIDYIRQLIEGREPSCNSRPFGR